MVHQKPLCIVGTTTTEQPSTTSSTTTTSDYNYDDYGCDGLFACDVDNLCVEHDVLCDGNSDCPNGKDEENCK